MKNFTYYRPTTADEAVGLLDAKWGTAELLAGGTDLLDLQKEYVAQPDKVVSVRDLARLSDIDVAGIPTPKDGPSFQIRIGAGATLTDIAGHAELRRLLPALTTAAGDIGG